MANEEVLGLRKTMFVLVIVVGCFAVLWPRILSPLLLGPSRDQLKPNQFDREAGCCEVLFDKDMAVLELINEVCSSALHSDGKLTPYTAAECRKAVNETCGVDLAAFLKRSENVGKTSKMLVETMKNSNSSCLKEHFGVHIWSLSLHQAQNSWTLPDTMKQERPIRAGPHPALKERGRAIPPGASAPARTIAMPPHVRPPPIPGMRPPLGNPGGPLPTPKSSMGFVMPVYTICIIVFFVYTLSKILFKRTGSSPYETVTPDPGFRRRVFRDDSRTTPDKLVVTAISGLVAEVQQQMEASYAQNQQRQDVQDNNTRPYTNGSILHNVGPVHIVASEYREQSKEKSPELPKEEEIPIENDKPVDEPTPDLIEHLKSVDTSEPKDILSEDETEMPEDILITDIDDLEQNEVQTDEEKEIKKLKENLNLETEKVRESSPEQTPVEKTSELEQDKSLENIFAKSYSEPELVKELTSEPIEDDKSSEQVAPVKDYSPELIHDVTEVIDTAADIHEEEEQEPSPTEALEEETKQLELVQNGEDATANLIEKSDELLKSIESLIEQSDGEIKKTEDFLIEEAKALVEEDKTVELLEEAIKDEEGEQEEENASVKVVGMEVTAHVADGGTCLPPAHPAPPAPPAPRHEAEQVQSIFLDTEIPQQSRVLVADFAEDRNDKPVPTKHSPMVVSGKMTLSLIQDAPRDTPERDLESTVDDFTTASAVTQNAAEKGEIQSDEEIEEEIEIEEIEEEVEEEEEEEVEPIEQKM